MKMKRYIETDKGTIKIEVYYTLGKIDHFTNTEEERGYYLKVSPVELEIVDDIPIEVYTGFTWLKTLLLERSRQSEKAFNMAVEVAEEIKEDVIEEFLETL